MHPHSSLQVDGRFTSAADPIEEKVERKVTVESLGLEPLCDEVVVFFYIFLLTYLLFILLGLLLS